MGKNTLDHQLALYTLMDLGQTKYRFCQSSSILETYQRNRFHANNIIFALLTSQVVEEVKVIIRLMEFDNSMTFGQF